MGIVEELFEKKKQRTQNYGSASTPVSSGNDQVQPQAAAPTGNTGIVEQLFAKKNKTFTPNVGTVQKNYQSSVQPTIKNDALSVEAAQAQFDAAKKAEEDAWAAYNQYNNSTHWSTVDMDKMDALSADIMAAQKAREEAEQKLQTMKYGAEYAEKYGVGSGLQGFDKGVISIGKSIGATPGVIAQTGKAAYEEGTAENADPEVLAARAKKEAAQRAVDSYMAAYMGYLDFPEQKAELDRLKGELAKATAELDAAESKHAVKLDMTTKPMQNMLTAGFLAEDATSDLSGVSKDVADAALSVGQNLPFVAAGFIPTVGPALALGGMSAVAGAQDMAQQGAAGKSAGEVFQHGVAVAAIEAMTEKMPLDNLADMVKKGGKSFIVNLFKQAGIEAAEEGVSYTMNYILDKAEGDPNAKLDWNEFFQSVKLGGLSGLFFGLGGTAIGSTNANTATNPEIRPATPSGMDAIGRTEENPTTGIPAKNAVLGANEGQNKTAPNIAEPAKEINGVPVEFLEGIKDGAWSSDSFEQNASYDGVNFSYERFPGASFDEWSRNAYQAYLQAVKGIPAAKQTEVELPPILNGQKNSAPANAETEQITSESNMERFRTVIDGVFTGALPTGSDIVVGNTPYILQQYGAPDLKLRISQNTVRKIVYPAGYMGGKHNLGMSAMKQLPYQIADPVAILKSKSQPNSMVLLTEWKTQDGQDVIVPIHLNKQGAVEVGNAVASAYGTSHIDTILGENDGNVIYTKNSENIRQLLSNGLQLPEAMADDVLAKNTIPQNEDGVKEQYTPERGAQFGETQQPDTSLADLWALKGPEDGVGETSDTVTPRQTREESNVSPRKALHQRIVDNIKSRFAEKGFDFDKVLKEAKNLSTFSTVDNIPQRVMEKALGYKEGQILSDITINQVAQNETEGIKWLNEQVNTVREISKQYGIKPGSKASAAAQMYAEGFYVAENNDIISYGDTELAKDFPDAEIRENIKRLAGDARIRQIYDNTLAMINESRKRNAYPEIQKLDNYFLHFRAMNDTFSKLGLPFNPNDIRAKDLPTDLNGVTADLKPGQPYFASSMHRKGKRTSFDLLGGLEKYLNSAKNQIYHIDDIQTLRAVRNYIAENYGQANGLEDLDTLSEEEAQERIEKVYNSHLSTFAKFLNEEANILAGKTALIDRGLEGIFGRRGITFLNELNRQVGSNMVGMNISSSLTNFLPVAQTFAKTNKFDFIKAFAQTVGNKVGSMFGKTDGFAENSSVIIRRKGADTFYRTPFQKVSDAGYILMTAVDNVSTELIARTKYNELVRKGMDTQKAHYETDKWVSRLMGDRSIGQMPQLYNSKMLGIITKFQLEVRNQLDSQFYDTIAEAKVSNEEVQNKLARNAKTAAKVTSTFVQLAVVQHLFGKAFESVAGYNPAFDIIEVLIKTFGFDDDEESEDTALDNIEEGFLTLLGDLPYTSTFTGGRIPIASALPIEELITGVDDYGNEKSRLDTLGEAAPYYLLPTGYGQIKKTYQGLSMFSDANPVPGSYTDSGNLRFPVEETPANIAQAAIFGQWASENARDYFDNDRTPIPTKYAEAAKEASEHGVDLTDYMTAYRGMSGMSEAEKRAYIQQMQLSDEEKAYIYRYSMLSSTTKESERMLFDDLVADGMDVGAVGMMLMAMKDAEDTSGKLDVIAQAELPDSAAKTVLGSVMGTELKTEKGNDTEYAKLLKVIDTPLSTSDAIRMKADGLDLDQFLEFESAGVDAKAARDLLEKLERLTPKNGSDSVTNLQKYRVVVDCNLDERDQMDALSVLMPESEFGKLQVGIDYGVAPDTYVGFKESLPKYDFDGNGSYKQAEVRAAIDAMDIDDVGMKAALWQLMTSSKSAKNNPYSVSVGQKICEAMS